MPSFGAIIIRALKIIVLPVKALLYFLSWLLLFVVAGIGIVNFAIYDAEAYDTSVTTCVGRLTGVTYPDDINPGNCWQSPDHEGAVIEACGIRQPTWVPFSYSHQIAASPTEIYGYCSRDLNQDLMLEIFDHVTVNCPAGEFVNPFTNQCQPECPANGTDAGVSGVNNSGGDFDFCKDQCVISSDSGVYIPAIDHTLGPFSHTGAFCGDANPDFGDPPIDPDGDDGGGGDPPDGGTGGDGGAGGDGGGDSGTGDGGSGGDGGTGGGGGDAGSGGDSDGGEGGSGGGGGDAGSGGDSGGVGSEDGTGGSGGSGGTGGGGGSGGAGGEGGEGGDAGEDQDTNFTDASACTEYVKLNGVYVNNPNYPACLESLPCEPYFANIDSQGFQTFVDNPHYADCNDSDGNGIPDGDEGGAPGTGEGGLCVDDPTTAVDECADACFDNPDTLVNECPGGDGDGDGQGDGGEQGQCQDDPNTADDECTDATEVDDPFYESKYGNRDQAVDDALGNALTAVTNQPIFSSLNNFFTFNRSGTCPTWDIDTQALDWNIGIEFDFFCAPWIPWSIISGILLATALFFSVRIALG